MYPIPSWTHSPWPLATLRVTLTRPCCFRTCLWHCSCIRPLGGWFLSAEAVIFLIFCPCYSCTSPVERPTDCVCSNASQGNLFPAAAHNWRSTTLARWSTCRMSIAKQQSRQPTSQSVDVSSSMVSLAYFYWYCNPLLWLSSVVTWGWRGRGGCLMWMMMMDEPPGGWVGDVAFNGLLCVLCTKEGATEFVG